MVPGLKVPGYLSIDALVFQFECGNTRGTSPLSLTGSLWYNFHIFGITLVPMLLGIAFQSVYHAMVLGRKTVFRVLMFAGVAGILGSGNTAGQIRL